MINIKMFWSICFTNNSHLIVVPVLYLRSNQALSSGVHNLSLFYAVWFQKLEVSYFLDFFPLVLLISVPARTRVQFEGGNKTRVGSISLGSTWHLGSRFKVQDWDQAR